MEVITKRELKEYIYSGYVTDITRMKYTDFTNWVKGKKLNIIAISVGIYGISGALTEDTITGEKYVITDRTSVLIALVT